MQRGTPALLSKYVRAEMALRAGADLVLELPVSCATASAELFARSGVQLLDGLGVVETLCFGSECGDTEILMKLEMRVIKQKGPMGVGEAIATVDGKLVVKAELTFMVG